MEYMLILLSPLIFFTNFALVKSQTEYAITPNQCYYLPNKMISGGSQTTTIFLSSIDALTNLGTCCDYCQALKTNCVAWYLASNRTCIFYRSVSGMSTGESTSYYLGHGTFNPFWDCNEEPNKWYISGLLVWARQGVLGNRFACCQACFFNSNCASWMFTDDGNSCYFSATSHVNTQPAVTASGFYTGRPTPSFKPFEL
jgi:hypothetical protein